MTTKQCLGVLIQHLEKRRAKNELAVVLAKSKNKCVVKYQASIRIIDRMLKIIDDAGENGHNNPNPHDFLDVIEWIIQQTNQLPHDKNNNAGVEVFVFLEILEHLRNEIFEMAIEN